MSVITPPLFCPFTFSPFHHFTFLRSQSVSGVFHVPIFAFFANSQIYTVSETGWGICIEKDGDNVFYILFGKVFGGENEKNEI